MSSLITSQLPNRARSTSKRWTPPTPPPSSTIPLVDPSSPGPSPLLSRAPASPSALVREGIRSTRRALRVLRATLPGSGPVYAHVGVTHRCDLTCTMCAIWKEGNKSTEQSPAAHARIGAALRDEGVLVVSLGGGEPLVREDLPEIVAAYARCGLDVRVLTNGQRATDSLLASLVSAGMRGASVSLDSLSAPLFDRICEREGAWDRAVSAMEKMARWLPPPLGPLVMNCVVSEQNLSELPDLVTFAEVRGFQASFLPVELPRHGDTKNKFIRDPGDMVIPPHRHQEVKAVYQKLLEMKSRGRGVFNTSRYLEMSREYFITGNMPGRCDAGNLYLSVSPEGHLGTCHIGPSLGPAQEGQIRHRLEASAAKEGPPRTQDWCGEGCVRACWHEVSYTFRDPHSFLETVRDRSRIMAGWERRLE